MKSAVLKPVNSKTVTGLRNDFIRHIGPIAAPTFALMENLRWTAVFITDREGRIIFSNSYNARINGWDDPKVLLGHPMTDLPEGDLIYQLREDIMNVCRTGVPVIRKLNDLKTKIKTSINIAIINPEIGLDGKPTGAIAYCYCDKEVHPFANRYDAIKESIFYIRSHLDEKLSIPELAKQINISESQYRKLFAELTQTSPTAYIADMRVSLAKSLLTITDAKISDIAAQTGFYDQAHFIRTFRSVTKSTPSAFRAAAQAERKQKSGGATNKRSPVDDRHAGLELHPIRL